MAEYVDIGSCKQIHDREYSYQDEKCQEDVPVLAQSVIVKPIPDCQCAHKRKDSAGGTHSNRVRLEDGAQYVALVRTHSQQDKVLLPALHLLLHSETNHEDAENIPE